METIIKWNVANWLTVFLMAFLGFAVLGLGIKTVNRVRGGNATS